MLDYAAYQSMLSAEYVEHGGPFVDERIPEAPGPPCKACVALIEQRRGPLAWHPTQAQQVERERLWAAQHLIHMFRDKYGRDARSVKEFEDWVRTR